MNQLKGRKAMMLKEIMTPEVEVVRPNSTLKEAARKMKDLDVGLIPVCDGDRLCGMLTDRDITVRSTALGNDPAKTPVEGVMTQEVVYAFEHQDEEAAASLMEEKQIWQPGPLIKVVQLKHFKKCPSRPDPHRPEQI